MNIGLALLLSLVLLPVFLLLLRFLLLLVLPGTEEELSCLCGNFKVRPRESSAPYWWWELKFRRHRKTLAHRIWWKTEGAQQHQRWLWARRKTSESLPSDEK